ncbi:MAG: zf-CHY type zinc finger protein [Amphiamblys sp. WSBS2006]|nr:MAG: zf-CHY type zinc finger protein [Amphiamblys sp. WSBS2006]
MHNSANKTLPPVAFTQQAYPGVGTSIVAELETGSISLLAITTATIAMACKKCTHQTVIAATHNIGTTRAPCSKCGRLLEIEFYPEYVYPGKKKMGTLVTRNGRCVDIPEMTVQVTCAKCVPGENTSASSMQMAGVRPGEHRLGKCPTCYTELSLRIRKTLFVVELASEKKKKPVDKVKLSPGEPLPETGTCKHYKKSYRWLRFRCCGRLFPCDICHEEEINGPDGDRHVPEMAARMVCGFCSREQNVGETCLCGKGTTKGKQNPFWEGGKGVRNTVALSKKDSKKYKGAGRQKTEKH